MDSDTRLPDLLHDLAREMPVDVEASARRVVHRARRHRVATALVASAAAFALVVGGVSVLQLTSSSQAGRDRIGVATSAPVPTPSPTVAPPSSTAAFDGVWPETTAAALAEAQAQVDAGDDPLRLDPAQTAAMLATNLFGWQPDDVQTRTTESGDERFVELRNRAFDAGVPPITVDVTQLGRTGPDGIWSVVKVSSPLLDDAWMWFAAVNGTDLAVQASVSHLPDGVAVQIEVLNGAIPEPSSPSSTTTPEGGEYVDVVSIAGIDVDSAVLWVLAVDDHGVALGATATPLASLVAPETPGTGDAPQPGTHETPLPAAVVAAHDAIQLAAVDHDTAGIVDLIDPTVFAFDFGDARGLVPALRDDPALFDTIAQLLALPFWVNDTEGTNVTYVWPAFMKPGALDHLSDTDRAQLNGLGFSDAQIDQMARSGSYLGPRLGIDQDGTWIYVVTGGD